MILQDALQIMDDFTPEGDKVSFSVKYVTYDRTRKTGGEIKELKSVRKIGSVFHQKERQMINVLAPGNSRHPYPIHIRLILEFNGEKVFW